MYKISFFNNGIETVIHYPDPEAPKIISPHLNIKRSQAGSLTFSIYPSNPGYNLITRFTTLIKVTDIRDNKIVFNGRVLSLQKIMSDNKEIKKDVICEGTMNYLQDSRVGSKIYEDATPLQVITDFLNLHNQQVEVYKQVQAGIVDVKDWLFFTSDYEATLDAIQKYVYDPNKGFLRFRTENGINYLDYMANPPQDKVVDIILGKNLKGITVDDSQIFGTRIIPKGSNSLTIDNVNGGKNYLEDSVAVAKYGIIYQTVDYSDIDDDEQLKTECQSNLSQYTQPVGSLDITALDLSTLADTSADSIDTTTSVHIQCPAQGVNDIYKVLEVDADLDKPWNPKLTLSNKPTTLSSNISEIQNNSINRNTVYGGVQLGYRFGMRILSHDGNVEILENGKEGISISNAGAKVFYVDTDGNLVTKKVTSIDMIAQEMKTSNTTSYMILHDQYMDIYSNGVKIMSFGYFTIDGTTQIVPAITFPNGNIHSYKNYGLNVYSNDRLSIHADNSLYLSCANNLDLSGATVTINNGIAATTTDLNNAISAVEAWVSQNFQPKPVS